MNTARFVAFGLLADEVEDEDVATSEQAMPSCRDIYHCEALREARRRAAEAKARADEEAAERDRGPGGSTCGRPGGSCAY